MRILLVVLEAIATLLVVPAGLAALPGIPRPAVLGWRWLAPPAVLALLLPRGLPAAAVAVPWALLTVHLALLGARRGLATLRGAEDRWAAWPAALGWFALAGPVVAGTAHLAERAGIRLFGFGLRTLALTVAHLQVAGFAAVLLAAWAASAAAGHREPAVRRAGTVAGLLLPAGVLLVLVGFFLSDQVELAGTVAVAAGLWAAAAVLWRVLRPSTADPRARALLTVAALVPVPTMLLALAWALGEAAGTPRPSLTWMLATHGVGNALGVALCGLLAHRLLAGSSQVSRPPQVAR